MKKIFILLNLFNFILVNYSKINSINCGKVHKSFINIWEIKLFNISQTLKGTSLFKIKQIKRIIGGNLVKKGDWGWQVSIYIYVI